MLPPLHQLNEGRKGAFVFLHSKDDVEERPDWLGSACNKPIPYDDDEEEPEDSDEEEEPLLEEVSSGAIPSEEDLETWFDPYGPKHKVAAPITPTYQTAPAAKKQTKETKHAACAVRPHEGMEDWGEF